LIDFKNKLYLYVRIYKEGGRDRLCDPLATFEAYPFKPVLNPATKNKGI
jgi:hypothetical protein